MTGDAEPRRRVTESLSSAELRLLPGNCLPVLSPASPDQEKMVYHQLIASVHLYNCANYADVPATMLMFQHAEVSQLPACGTLAWQNNFLLA